MNIFRFLLRMLFLVLPMVTFAASMHEDTPAREPSAPIPISFHKVGFIVYFGDGTQCVAGRATVQAPRTQEPDMIELIGKAILVRPEIVEKCPNAKVIVWLIHGISM